MSSRSNNGTSATNYLLFVHAFFGGGFPRLLPPPLPPYTHAHPDLKKGTAWQSMSKGRQFIPTVRNTGLCSPSSFQDENAACGLNPEYFAASTAVECVSQGISGTVARSILFSCRIDTVTGIIHSEASWHFPGEATLVRRREICIQVTFICIKMLKVPSVVLGLICGGLLNRNRARESYICAACEKVQRYDVSFQCCEFTSTETVRLIRD